MRRQLAVLFTVGLLLSACGDSSPQPSAGPEQNASPTPNINQPDGVAQAFLDAWMEGNYTGMYSLLSPNSQASYTEEEFTNFYVGTATTMTLIEGGVDAALLSSLSDTTGTTAQLRFRVTYNTLILGEVVADNMTMNLVFVGERWGISWDPRLIFPNLTENSTLQLEVETPSRANIYDRNGLWLVSANAATVTISITPSQISSAYEDTMLNLLSEVLRMSPEEIRQQYAGLPEDWQIALGDADAETVQANWSALSSYPGLGFSDKSGRRYFNVLASHVLGYTSYIPREEIDDYRQRGYQGDEIVGLSGLERWGEEYLAGTRGGVLSAYTPNGLVLEIARRDPQPAQSIYTTLDRSLQAIVQDAMEDAYRAGAETWVKEAGGMAVVIMDVNSGAVLAMASYPYFDPNVLNPYNSHPGLTDTYLQDLYSSPLKPFFNRSTQGEYPPGSIFKLVSAATALESGLFQPTSTYNSTGLWAELGAEYTKYDWREGGHGLIAFPQWITASCNSCFYHVGLVTGREDFNLLPNYARQFGFGSELGIEIIENSGLVPDPALGTSDGREWGVLDSVNLAIGQGDLLVTPLQVAVMISAIANGGTVYRPHLVDHIGLIGEEPSLVFEPEVIREVPVDPEYLELIREAMRAVVADRNLGTAEYRLGSLQISAAGKTGTAQVSIPGAPPNAWFAGFVPYEEPELAVVVLVENGGQGSGVAAPIFRRIVEKWYDLRVLDWPRDWGDPDLFEFVPDDAIGP